MENTDNKILPENKEENKNQIQSQDSSINSQNYQNIIQQQQISFKKPNERIKTKVIKLKNF